MALVQVARQVPPLDAVRTPWLSQRVTGVNFLATRLTRGEDANTPSAHTRTLQRIQPYQRRAALCAWQWTRYKLTRQTSPQLTAVAMTCRLGAVPLPRTWQSRRSSLSGSPERCMSSQRCERHPRLTHGQRSAMRDGCNQFCAPQRLLERCRALQCQD